MLECHSRVKQVVVGCKEVIKVNRYLSVLDDYKIIREEYKQFILDRIDFDEPLSYFRRVMKKRIRHPPPFGPYKLMIGNYYDTEVENEIKELEEIYQMRQVLNKDIQEQLFEAKN